MYLSISTAYPTVAAVMSINECDVNRNITILGSTIGSSVLVVNTKSCGRDKYNTPISIPMYKAYVSKYNSYIGMNIRSMI